MPITQSHLAKQLGISQRSVSVAFGGAGRISEQTRKSVLEAARELGYRPNRLASSLRKGQSGSIGVVWAFANPWTGDSQIGMGVLQRLQERKLTTYQAHHGEGRDVDLLCHHLNDLLGRRVDAIVMHGIPADLTHPKVLKLIEGVPVAAVCREELPKFPGDLVIHDRDQAIRDVVDDLVAKGRRRLAIALTIEQESNPPKFKAFRERCRYHGLPEHAHELIKLERSDRPATGGERHLAAMRRVFPGRVDVDAIFCVNDVGAMYVMRDLFSRGLSVPGDVAVVGLNNTEPGAVWDPPLATVDRCYDAVADALDGMIAGRLADPDRPPQRQTIHMKYIPRASAG